MAASQRSDALLAVYNISKSIGPCASSIDDNWGGKVNRTRVFNLILGISLSVIIYYIRYFFNLLGENDKIPIIMSIWFPLIIITILCGIGLVRINEK